MNSITPEQADKIETLKLQLVGIKNTIVSAIEAAGFTVGTSHQNPHTTFPRFLLDVTSAKLEKWSKTVFVELVAGRYTTTPEKVQVSYKASNIGRGRMGRFTVLDSIDSKLVAVLSEDLTASIEFTKSRTAAEADNGWPLLSDEQKQGAIALEVMSVVFAVSSAVSDKEQAVSSLDHIRAVGQSALYPEA